MAITSGEKKKAWEEALTADLTCQLSALEEVHRDIITLEDVVQGLPRLAQMLAKQKRTLELMESEFREEIKEVPNTIAGLEAKREPMTERGSHITESEPVLVTAE